MEPTTLNSLFEKLTPMVHKKERVDLARAIHGIPTKRNHDELSKALAASNTGLQPLLSLLLQCQWAKFKQISEQTPQDAEQLVHETSNLFKNFSSLQTKIISAFEKHWESNLQHERYGRIISDCKANWVMEGNVDLRNYFNEIPVRTKAQFIGVSDDFLLFEVKDDFKKVFAVSSDSREISTHSPDRKHTIYFRANKFKNGKLWLSIKTIEQSCRDGRKDLRVRLEAGLPMKLSLVDQSIDTTINDISMSGLGFSYSADTSIAVGSQLMAPFKYLARW